MSETPAGPVPTMRPEKKVLSERHYRRGDRKRGYVVRTELVDGDDGPNFTMKSAYNEGGVYIGSSKDAHFLCTKKGIEPQPAHPADGVCSIGFSEEDQKWYGWSHRAMHGFAVGDVVEKGDLCNSSGWTDEYLAEHPEEDSALPAGFTAKSLSDARRMAVAFAEAVS